jgi:hypothetical protein
MGSINIIYQDATLTSSSSRIAIQNGSFDLTPADALSISGSVMFNSLYMTAGAMTFNVESGTVFYAAIDLPVSRSSRSGDPEVVVTNFLGSVTLTWPTASGPESQSLGSGDPITLTGYAG